MKLIIRWVIASLSLFVADWLVPGIYVKADGSALTVFIVMAVILGLVNAIVRPILTLLSCPLIILTLGLFLLVVNALSLWLASYIANSWFGVGFIVDGFWSALLGSIVISLVSFILSLILPDGRRQADNVSPKLS